MGTYGKISYLQKLKAGGENLPPPSLLSSGGKEPVHCNSSLGNKLRSQQHNPGGICHSELDAFEKSKKNLEGNIYRQDISYTMPEGRN